MKGQPVYIIDLDEYIIVSFLGDKFHRIEYNVHHGMYINIYIHFLYMFTVVYIEKGNKKYK